jgi:hypothetical protein
LRGSTGKPIRAINIPWVLHDHTYQVNACLMGKSLGRFTGRELQNGSLSLELPAFGQEILEVSLVPAPSQ